jgi:SAM-dependent methyltransferase
VAHLGRGTCGPGNTYDRYARDHPIESLRMPTLQTPFSPSAERNKQPILEMLRQQVPERGRALEIASGTGQHAAWFASALPNWTWQPTDRDPRDLPGIAANAALAGSSNVLSPLVLDVMASHWPSGGEAFAEAFDLVYCANMLHIAPWPCCAALMRGCARHLAATGRLIVYGPFFEQGTLPAPGNLAFDTDLRARDPAWGIRTLDEVQGAALAAGLRLESRHTMPANNLLLVWQRS